jgi:DNA invertase Pin-like site-specific DNA recombinase
VARKSRKPGQAEDSAVKAAFAPTPAWIYARISNDSERAEDSIDNQVALCKDYIRSCSELTLNGVFTDLGYSGTNFERPGYSGMMASILCGDIKCVVVKDLSRLGRTYIEVGELLFDTFVQRGVRFVSVNDSYDSFADDAGRKKLLILFKNLVNHMYSRDLGKKIKSAHNVKKQRGEAAGVAPYGYRKNRKEKRLDVCPEEAEVVKRIFALRLQGESVMNISRILNRGGVPSPQNRRYNAGEAYNEMFAKRIVWTPGLVSRLLHSETYTGALVQGIYACNGKKKTRLPKELWIIHENKHEAIISKEQYKAVALLMEKSAEKYKHTNLQEHVENRYSGIITCSRCGKTVIRSESRVREPILYYYACPHCVSELKHERGIKRGAKMPLKKLDAIIMETLRKHMDALVHFDNLAEILAQSDPLKQKRALLKKESARLEKSVSDAERNISSAYAHHMSGLLDLREYGLVRAKVEREQGEVKARLTQIKSELAKYDAKNVMDNQWLVKYRDFRDCETPTKDMVQALVRRIVLTPLTNELEIKLNYMDSFEDLRKLLLESGADGI